MSKWKVVLLRDLSKKITKGTTPSTYGFSFQASGINYIRAEGISKDGYVDTSTFNFICEECHEKLSRSKLEVNDILFSIAGMALGKTGIVKEEYLPANTNQAVAIIRLKKDICEPKFIQYYFVNSAFYKLVNSVSAQSAQPNINLTQIGNLKINLPPLLTQQKIASILSAYDDLIENNLKRIKLLEEAAQNLYKEWFVHFRFPGYEDVEFKNGLPEGWSIKRFDNILSFKTGKLDSNAAVLNGQYPFFTCSQEIFKTNTFSFDTEAVLLGGNNASGIYPLKYYKGKFDAYQRTYVIKPIDNLVSHQYVFLVLSNLLGFLQSISTGAATKFLTLRILNQLEMVIPAAGVNHDFERVIKPMFSQIQILSEYNQSLKTARDILLPRLMNQTIQVD